MKFTIESFRACEVESRPLQVAHWSETEEFRHRFDFNPDHALRFRMEESGNFVYATARTDEGKLVGHCSFTIRPRSFYSENSQAFEDFVFINPENRRGRNFLRLWNACEEELKRRGVKELRVSSNADKSRLWESLGYKEVTRTYCKIVGD
jgi:hypothetical protein